MKRIMCFSLILIVFLSAAWGTAYRRLKTAERHIAEQQAYRIEFENRTVTEQMMSIQRQVGCKLIDGEIGTETMPLINAAVRAEKKRELMNQYAIESFERMAKGDKK